MEAIRWLQEWYALQCNGECEHQRRGQPLLVSDDLRRIPLLGAESNTASKWRRSTIPAGWSVST